MTRSQTIPKHSRVSQNLPKCDQNSKMKGGGRVWRLYLMILTDLKISSNVIKDYNIEPIGGGLKFPSTTKSLS